MYSNQDLFYSGSVFYNNIELVNSYPDFLNYDYFFDDYEAISVGLNLEMDISSMYIGDPMVQKIIYFPGNNLRHKFAPVNKQGSIIDSRSMLEKILIKYLLGKKRDGSIEIINVYFWTRENFDPLFHIDLKFLKEDSDKSYCVLTLKDQHLSIFKSTSVDIIDDLIEQINNTFYLPGLLWSIFIGVKIFFEKVIDNSSIKNFEIIKDFYMRMINLIDFGKKDVINKLFIK